MSDITQLHQQAAKLPHALAVIDGELKAVRLRMRSLQRDALIYAAEHWREDKYLYLIYPMQGGARRREYIGADPGRIAEARAGIARARKYEQLAAELKQLEARLDNGVAALEEAVRQLECH